jgi:hypothetical protein
VQRRREVVVVDRRGARGERGGRIGGSTGAPLELRQEDAHDLVAR